MRREQEVLRLAQRMIRRQRLGHDHIERRARKMAGIERRDERVLVDGRAAADIDNVSALGEKRHARCVQDIHRVAHGGERHEEKVGLGQELIQRRHGIDLVKIRLFPAAAAHAGQARGMERAHAAGKFRADIACAEAGDARAVERVDAAGLLFSNVCSNIRLA